MPLLQEIVEHEGLTDYHQYRYIFTPKHHGAVKKEAQWLPDLSLDDEFRLFNSADLNELADAAGNLYGAERVGDDDLRDLGTRGEQVARFPIANANEAWHGYPAWPLTSGGNRAGEDMKPPRQVLQRMKDVGIITRRGRKRLNKGDRV